MEIGFGIPEPVYAGAPVPAEVYENALDLLRLRGWCQGTSQDLSGRICLAHAVGVAAHEYQRERGAWSLSVFDYSALYAAIGSSDIAGRNDDPSTSYEDVTLWLKHAAEVAREAVHGQGALR
jgi:hypothetical protein